MLRSRSALILAVVSALVCGAAVALFKGDGSGTYAMAIGNISSPWLFPSLPIGYAVRNKVVAGLLGVAVTWLMLASFYAAYESQGLLGSAIHAEVERYFVFGVIAGSVCAVVASAIARPTWLVTIAASLLFCEGWAWTHTPEALTQRFPLPSLPSGANGAHHQDAWNIVFWGERIAAFALMAALVVHSRRARRGADHAGSDGGSARPARSPRPRGVAKGRFRRCGLSAINARPERRACACPPTPCLASFPHGTILLAGKWLAADWRCGQESNNDAEARFAVD